MTPAEKRLIEDYIRGYDLAMNTFFDKMKKEREEIEKQLTKEVQIESIRP
jgi:hypothetical protein